MSICPSWHPLDFVPLTELKVDSLFPLRNVGDVINVHKVLAILD